MKPKFKVGDIVRVRDWDDMAHEFGTTDTVGETCIETGSYVFLNKMRHLCGVEFEIKEIHYVAPHEYDYGNGIEAFRHHGDAYWFITESMLEAVEPEPEIDDECDASADGLLSILGVCESV